MTPAASAPGLAAGPNATDNSAAGTPLIQTHELRQSFQIGKRRLDVLRGISLEIWPGTAAFLVGASGAGKTTLLYTMAGLEPPASGKVIFEGESVYDLGRRAQSRLRNRRMGFVFQGYFLLGELTARKTSCSPP